MGSGVLEGCKRGGEKALLLQLQKNPSLFIILVCLLTRGAKKVLNFVSVAEMEVKTASMVVVGTSVTVETMVFTAVSTPL